MCSYQPAFISYIEAKRRLTVPGSVMLPMMEKDQLA